MLLPLVTSVLLLGAPMDAPTNGTCHIDDATEALLLLATRDPTLVIAALASDAPAAGTLQLEARVLSVGQRAIHRWSAGTIEPGEEQSVQLDMDALVRRLEPGVRGLLVVSAAVVGEDGLRLSSSEPIALSFGFDSRGALTILADEQVGAHIKDERRPERHIERTMAVHARKLSPDVRHRPFEEDAGEGPR